MSKENSMNKCQKCGAFGNFHLPACNGIMPRCGDLAKDCEKAKEVERLQAELRQFSVQLGKLKAENEKLKTRCNSFGMCDAAVADYNFAVDLLLEEIKQLQAEIAKLNIILYHKENGLSHPDLQGEIDKSKFAELQAENKWMAKYVEQAIGNRYMLCNYLWQEAMKRELKGGE